MLPAWTAPAAVPTARLRAALFAEEASVAESSWWHRLWRVSFRIPLPVALALGLLVAAGVWRWWWTFPAQRVIAPEPRVVVRTERVEVPVVQRETVTVYRDRVVRVPVAVKVDAQAQQELRPVLELKPRIIRGTGNVQN